MNKEIELKPCREAFKEWAGQPFMYSNLTKSDDGEWYMCNETQNAWCGWQAAQAQLQAENERLRSRLQDALRIINEEPHLTIAYRETIKLCKAALQHNEGQDDTTS